MLIIPELGRQRQGLTAHTRTHPHKGREIPRTIVMSGLRNDALGYLLETEGVEKELSYQALGETGMGFECPLGQRVARWG